jgi:hypothetical protein
MPVTVSVTDCASNSVARGHTEVEDLGKSKLVRSGGTRYQDVVGLQVAVNDTAFVGMVKSVAHPGHQLDALCNI